MSTPDIYYSQAYLDANIGWQLTAVAISFLVLDCGFVALRFYARHLQQRSFGLDDTLIIASLVFCLATQACAFVAIGGGGVGRHVQYAEQDYDTFRTWYQTCMIAIAVMYIFSAALPKLAILYLYLQIFVDKLSRWTTWATVAALICNIIVMVPLLVAKCHPISYGWKVLLDPEATGGWCADVEPRLQFASLANIVTDISMLLLPIPTLYRLQTDKGTKIGLALTFGMAFGGLVTSCFRFAAFFKTNAYTDETWASVELVSWCIVEPGIYMFVACQMTFRPLFMALLQTRIGVKAARMLPNFLYRYQSPHSSTYGKDSDRQQEPKLIPTRTSSPVRRNHSIGHSLLASSVVGESNDMLTAPPVVYDGHIWVGHEYAVRNYSYPQRRPSSGVFGRYENFLSPPFERAES